MTFGNLALLVFGSLFIAFLATLVMPVHGAECRGQLVKASWYGAESGSQTATQLPFDGTQWLVAHRTLPFGTKLRLTYKGRSVVVPVLDRGPYIKGRTLDLSHAVAKALGTVASGVPTICMERVG